MDHVDKRLLMVASEDFWALRVLSKQRAPKMFHFFCLLVPAVHQFFV